MKKLFCLFICIFVLATLSVMTASAETYSGECGENVTWTVDTDTGVLTISGEGAMWDYYDERPEWSDEYDWENPRNVKTAVIEEGITYIGAWAFSSCYSLKTVHIPASVEEIGYGAFAWAPIGEFIVDPDNESFVEIDGVLFTCDMKTLVAYSNVKEGGSYTVPSGVETIAFAAIINQYLAELIIPESVTQIYGRNSFIESFVVSENNSVYSSVDGVLFNKEKTILIAYPSYKRGTDYTVPYGITSIMDSAFVEVQYLKTLTLSESVTDVYSESIWGCWNLESITFESPTTLYLESSIGWCENLKEVTVYAQNVYLGYSEWLFNGCPDNLVIKCVKGSALDTFAIELGYNVEYIGKAIPEIKFIIDSSTAYIDGREIALQMPVIFKNDTLVAPARFLAAEFGDGTPMTWDAENLVLTFKNGGTTFELKANETIAKVNGEYVELDEPFYTIEENYPSIIDAYYLPIFFFTDTFGLEILWDLDEKSFTVNPKEIDDGEGEGEEEQPYTPETIITVGSKILYADGVAYTLDAAPILIDGEVLAPARCVSDIVLATISWNDETRTATFEVLDKTVELTIGSTVAKVNGEDVIIPVAPVIEDGRAFFPVRFVVETFGQTVAWDADTQTMTINPKESGSEEDTTVASGDIEMQITVGSSTAYINGVKKEMTFPAFIENDAVMVPASIAVEGFKALGGWYDEDNTCYNLLRPSVRVFFTIDSNEAIVNGETVTISQAAIVRNGIVMLPLHFVAETFGATATWDAESQTMKISYKAVYSGSCGENVTWEYDNESGTLTIGGSGPMYDYPDDNVPWCANFDIEFLNIKHIAIEDGVTYIGRYAFHSCSASEVEIPDSVTEIGYGAFAVCYNLESITLPSSVTTICEWAFGLCEKLTSIVIPKSVTTIKDIVFGGSNSVTVKCYKGSAIDVYAKTNGIAVEYIEKIPDFSGDGVLDVSDATTLIDAVLCGEALDGADLNGDGKVSILDIVKLIAMLIK
nr:leucine-rich repeat protein [Clostridia bacterium]